MSATSILAALLVLAPGSIGPDLASNRSIEPRQSPQDAARAVEWGRAPDGEKGFGTGRTMRDIERLLSGVVNFTGLHRTHLPALLDASPLSSTLNRVIDFEAIADNVADGELISAAVVATSALTGRSVVFHCGGTPDEIRDDKRGIDYVATPRFTEQHVRASAAIAR